jgi:DNA-binding Xre family transcriptional regulator
VASSAIAWIGKANRIKNSGVELYDQRAQNISAQEKQRRETLAKEEEEDDRNESFVVIGVVIAAVVGYGLFRRIGNKILGHIGKQLDCTPEELTEYINKVTDEAVVDMAGPNKTRAENWRKYMLEKIDSGEIKTLGDVEKELGVAEQEWNK